ncbi:hypothetical protein Q672_09205 [Marinobacter sp. EVN1]|uniref:hypothetical protein n=1 Tax=Marinobacter sp. EVN1 TaxID=1397532 RepID=UPI0003B7EF5A|nr:hypothetical protein [Marinobacter sp. EVN1]ERS81477.1 hypothetical protein Q672_09205 [Marinobacter sp. EVN1]
MGGKVVWFAWEDHRRSRELSSEFEAKYIPMVYRGVKIFRYPVLSLLTIYKILAERPTLVFCQNPSIILTFLLVMTKRIFGFKLVVDRHSNFKFEYESSKDIKWKIFRFVSKFTVKHSDLTIVTNDYLKSVCEGFGGVAMVLPDKLPDMSSGNLEKSRFLTDPNKVHVMAVTTFDSDEPIEEMIEAARCLGENYILYMTGNSDRYFNSGNLRTDIPNNLIFTGFVSEYDYKCLINSVDVVVVLTNKDFILNCGAYEAVSVDAPLVLSDTETLRGYFFKGPVFVKNNPESIMTGVVKAAENKVLGAGIYRDLKSELTRSWGDSFSKVRSFISDFVL